MYKTELHIHTSPISVCAHCDAVRATEHYIENGYTTAIITNHMSPSLFHHLVPEGMTEWRDIADLYLSDYRLARETAGGRINILLGMEIRVKKNMNDYLVYGIDEKFVYDMGNIMELTIKEVSQLVHAYGALIYQAHPFRDTMTITNPKYLDGIEAGNFCTTHDNRNDFADMWADRYDMLKVYGSDYHNECYMRGAGIVTDKPITDNASLLSVLRGMDFKFTDDGVNFRSPR